MDERSGAENPENGSECTGALVKCARTKLNWRTWEVRQYNFGLAHLPSARRSERPAGQALAGLVRVWSNSDAWLSH